jgi:hypothetical protein
VRPPEAKRDVRCAFDQRSVRAPYLQRFSMTRNETWVVQLMMSERRGPRLLLETQDDRCRWLEYRSETGQYVKELLDYLEKSSPVIEEALAVLPSLRHDGFGFKSVLEESQNGRFESRAWSTVCFDVRSCFLATMGRSSSRLSGSRARRFQRESSLR